MLIPSGALLSACHPVTPSPQPISPSATLCLFPRVRSLSWFVSLSNFSPLSSPLFSYNHFHYFLYSSYEWYDDLSFSDWLTSLSIIPSSSIHVEANGGYLSFLMSEQGLPFLSLHLLSLLWHECYCFNKWLTSLLLCLWSRTFLVFKASTWDCISVIAFLTLAWLDFSSFISTGRDSLVFFCALFPAQMLSL